MGNESIMPEVGKSGESTNQPLTSVLLWLIQYLYFYYNMQPVILILFADEWFASCGVTYVSSLEVFIDDFTQDSRSTMDSEVDKTILSIYRKMHSN